MRAFVVGDAHGRLDLVTGLLEHVGILKNRVLVDRETKVIQIGDLCNCVASSVMDDVMCLRAAPDLFHVYLVGNHEHPYFGGPSFSGFWPDTQVREILLRYEARGLMAPCISVDGILVSHAGLASQRGKGEREASVFCRWATREWNEDKNHSLFSAIGQSRGGLTAEGGIFWSDWSEPKRMAFPQVVGHTVGPDVRWKRNRDSWAVCIDVGSGKRSKRIAGCWLRDGVPEAVVYENGSA